MITTLAHAGLMALIMAAAMGWQMLWALVLGFLISGAIQAAVSHKNMAELLPDDRWPSIVKASALGAASSSCSYAAAAIARAIVKTGGDFRAAMAFQFASTNLVVELGLILLTLMGWRFMAASWIGGLVMIPIVVALLRLFLSRQRIEAATAQAGRDAPGRMEGHAAMDMSVDGPTILARLVSAKGFTAVAHFFYMDWASLWFGGLGSGDRLGASLPDGAAVRQPSLDRPPRRAFYRAARGDDHLRLLRRQRAPGGGAVARRRELWRRDRLHLRRPDRAAAA
jgi:uncharacterized membrane protein YraQ (UPF0718 family)